MSNIRLIFNADDFGRSSEENRAIMECVRYGPVRSVTVLANAAASAEISGLQAVTPALGVGAHINLTEGKPILPPEKVASLIGMDGWFFPKRALLRKLLLGKLSLAEVESEIRGQIHAVYELAGELSHVDSHQNVHIIPGIMPAVTRACRSLGVRLIRGQKGYYFPEARAKEGRAKVSNNWHWRRRTIRGLSQRIIARLGLESPALILGGMPGYLEKEVDINYLISWWEKVLAVLPDGTYEVVLHPGLSPAEVALLTNEGFKKLISNYKVRSISYHELQ